MKWVRKWSRRVGNVEQNWLRTPDFVMFAGLLSIRIEGRNFQSQQVTLFKKVKQLIHEGNITRIVVRDEKGRDLLEMSATVGVVGVILAPWLAVLGAIAALTANCTLVVERE